MAHPSLTRAGSLLLALVTAATLAGCAGADASDSSAPSVTNGFIGAQPDDGDPTPGGTLSYATLTGITSLDPTDRQDSGSTGGSEMAAIYDLLMRYDPVAKEYEPQLARSLSPNADGSVWTLSLRPDAMFSDGTPVDADAVVWSIRRYLDEKGTQAQVWQESVENMRVVDATTVQFTLKRPWQQFPFMLASGPGMIVAPSSMATGSFTAIGAGPFTVEQFAPQNRLTLTANPRYWGGPPALESVRFPVIQGEQPKLDALRNGDIDVAYLRRSDTIQNALSAGAIGFLNTVDMGAVGMINQRQGRAASDLRVRKAIVAAIDPGLYNERAEAGAGMPGSAMFQSWSTWHSDAPVSGYDPAAAKKYLDEAKADGYDGRLTYFTTNNAQTQKNALAYKSMLEAVGFTVDIQYAPTIADFIRGIYVDHDFDIAHSGMSVQEEAPFVRLYGNFHSDSASNVLGYANSDMDALLERVQSSGDVEDKRAALADVQKLVNQTAPLVTLGAGQVLVTWSEDVHGITPSADGIMLFDDAWVASGAQS
ncbi:ABC transporter substrate-binding protein [Tomitella gaofuii]|uniref:ABC transporter substrate-binding protein n=1 Tax=Tomitella gaofuii TaxID=2760083 RepID=UPI0015F82888|nr:ABC transporter substrate-binding protein [Tomitella gaofuii]